MEARKLEHGCPQPESVENKETQHKESQAHIETLGRLLQACSKTSTPQLPLKTRQILSHRDRSAWQCLNRGVLGGAGVMGVGGGCKGGTCTRIRTKQGIEKA